MDLNPSRVTSRVTHLIVQVREKRRAVEKRTKKGADPQAFTKSGFQIEELMVHFLSAAEVYDPIKLPRFRMMWLENLARLHELRQNKAEGAEIRWKIFELCRGVENTWTTAWVPRPPLHWNWRQTESDGAREHMTNGTGAATGDGTGGIGATGIAGIGAGGKASSSKSSSSSSSSSSSDQYISLDRNFYQVITSALDALPYRAWKDQQQYIRHKELALTVATEKFWSAHLIHLAERSTSHLMQMCRLNQRTELLAEQYANMASKMKQVVEKGISNSIAIGTFYHVL